MADRQKSPREMIIDRFVAAGINMDRLAIEEAGGSVRITGAVSSRSECQRVAGVLGDAQAQGQLVTYDIEVRPAETPPDDEPPTPDLRSPPEPA